MAFSKTARRLKIRRSIRSKIQGTGERPRLSVFKSNKAIYAQLINDDNGTTVAASSSLELGVKQAKIEDSKKVGIELAKKAEALKISNVVFDRGGYAYHGRVKALAEGAREGGLKF